MKGKWFVSFNPGIGYIVARVKAVKEVVHSGNIEYHGKYMEDKAECKRIADELNQEEGGVG